MAALGLSWKQPTASVPLVPLLLPCSASTQFFYARWADFYVIMGSAGGGADGLASGSTSKREIRVSHLAACLGALAIMGFVYSLTVIVHARKSSYQPDAEDWFWYAGLPVLSYVVLGVAASLAWFLAAWSLFIIAAISVLFLFMGIRNSWDTVTYVALKHGQRSGGRGE